MKNEVVVGLIKNRHNLPVKNYIFNQEVSFPLDFLKINKIIDDFIENNVGVTTYSGIGINNVAEGGCDTLCYKGRQKLVVYCTGLTACTAAVIKTCMFNGIPLTLMHYDNDTSAYVPQHIL